MEKPHRGSYSVFWWGKHLLSHKWNEETSTVVTWWCECKSVVRARGEESDENKYNVSPAVQCSWRVKIATGTTLNRWRQGSLIMLRWFEIAHIFLPTQPFTAEREREREREKERERERETKLNLFEAAVLTYNLAVSVVGRGWATEAWNKWRSEDKTRCGSSRWMLKQHINSNRQIPPSDHDGEGVT